MRCISVLHQEMELRQSNIACSGTFAQPSVHPDTPRPPAEASSTNSDSGIAPEDVHASTTTAMAGADRVCVVEMSQHVVNSHLLQVSIHPKLLSHGFTISVLTFSSIGANLFISLKFSCFLHALNLAYLQISLMIYVLYADSVC